MTLRDGASAGASCTVSPSFTSTLLLASHVRGRRNAASAEPRKTIAKMPSTSLRCLKTAYSTLRTATGEVAPRRGGEERGCVGQGLQGRHALVPLRPTTGRCCSASSRRRRAAGPESARGRTGRRRRSMLATHVFGTKTTAFGRRRTRSGTPSVEHLLEVDARRRELAVGGRHDEHHAVPLGRRTEAARSITACRGVMPGPEPRRRGAGPRRRRRCSASPTLVTMTVTSGSRRCARGALLDDLLELLLGVLPTASISPGGGAARCGRRAARRDRCRSPAGTGRPPSACRRAGYDSPARASAAGAA